METSEQPGLKSKWETKHEDAQFGVREWFQLGKE